jgi:hypothetical protein
MNEFIEGKPVPKWRLVFYGCLLAGVVAAFGVYQHNRNLLILAILLGIIIAGLGLVLNWSRIHKNPRMKFAYLVFALALALFACLWLLFLLLTLGLQAQDKDATFSVLDWVGFTVSWGGIWVVSIIGAFLLFRQFRRASRK